MRIFGREPAVFLNLLATALAMLVAVGILDLNEDQLAAVMLVASAVVAVGTAYFTRDVTLGVLVGVAEAIFTLLFSFGIELRPDVTASLLAVITAAFGFFQRTQTTPDAGFRTESSPA